MKDNFSIDDALFDKNKPEASYEVKRCIELHGLIYSLTSNNVWACTRQDYCPYQKKESERLRYCLRKKS